MLYHTRVFEIHATYFSPNITWKISTTASFLITHLNNQNQYWKWNMMWSHSKVLNLSLRNILMECLQNIDRKLHFIKMKNIS